MSKAEDYAADHKAAKEITKLLLENKRRERICFMFCHKVPLEFMNLPNTDGVCTPLLDYLTDAYRFTNELLDYVPEDYDLRERAEEYLRELELIRPFVRW